MQNQSLLWKHLIDLWYKLREFMVGSLPWEKVNLECITHSQDFILTVILWIVMRAERSFTKKEVFIDFIMCWNPANSGHSSLTRHLNSICFFFFYNRYKKRKRETTHLDCSAHSFSVTCRTSFTFPIRVIFYQIIGSLWSQWWLQDVYRA